MEKRFAMSTNWQDKIINSGIVFLTFFLSIFRAITIFGLRGFNCAGLPMQSGNPCIQVNFYIELTLWLLTTMMIFYELIKTKSFISYIAIWRRNWLVIGFIFLAFLSLIWTVSFPVTLTKALVLLACTISFSYLIWKNKLSEIYNFFYWFFIVLTLLNLFYVFGKPEFGIMWDVPYTGFWTGIFWHKNYLGAIMAFGSSLFLMNLLAHPNRHLIFQISDIVFLVSSIWIIIKSNSTAGLMILFLLVGICLILFLWLKIKIHLHRFHYIFIGCIGAISLITTLMNLDYVFGLFNRTTSLTGRIPMWQYLINNFISFRPWLGYGYGAIWAFQGFREQTRDAVGWLYQVVIGDNGLVDIVLHLGIIGVILIVLIFIQSVTQSIKLINGGENLISFLPVMGLLFVFLSNISLSMLLELEYLGWFLIVIPLFLDVDRSSPLQPDSLNVHNEV